MKSRMHAIAFWALLLLAHVLDRVAPVSIDAVQAIVNLWVQLALIVVSYALSVLLAPKPKPPPRQTAKLPVVKDGKRIVRVYGTVWIDDPMQLAMKQTDADPIKKKGGKK